MKLRATTLTALLCLVIACLPWAPHDASAASTPAKKKSAATQKKSSTGSAAKKSPAPKPKTKSTPKPKAKATPKPKAKTSPAAKTKSKAQSTPAPALPTEPETELEPEAEAEPTATPRPRFSPAPLSVTTDFAQFPEQLDIEADGAAVIDALTGEVIYEKNGSQALYPASTTKILTALLIIEAGNLDQEIVVQDEDAAVGESSLHLKPGQRFTRRQALYAIMLKSANDVSHALARDNAGSVPAFAAKMTQRAIELGATGSNFTNPHGLHDKEHFTTPRDLALISRAAMQQPFFRQLVASQSHMFHYQSDEAMRLLTNKNRLLRTFPGCTGVKTGFTRPARNCLVSAALWGTREVICVVLKTDRPGQWADSIQLLTYAFSRLPELTLAQSQP